MELYLVGKTNELKKYDLILVTTLSGRRKLQKITIIAKLFIKFKTAKLNDMLVGYIMYMKMIFLKGKKHFIFFRSLNLHMSLR